jgi:eukaryotic-like serine/threonine-protein kinase
MDVGNDPFPREEVTGLAAFENLEPVGSLSVLPPEPAESEPPPPGRPQPPSVAARRAEGSTPPALPPGAAASREPRADATMPLDLSAEIAGPREDDTGRTGVSEDEPTADHLFDTSSDSPGWDDPDEATRVASEPPFGASQSAALNMDWDEDEPPTRMRAEGMLDMPKLGVPVDWDDANSATQIYDTSVSSAFVPSSGTTLTGGRPSPFPPAPQPSAAAAAAPRSSQALGAPSPFATTAVGAEHWADSLRGGDRRAWAWAGGGALGLIVLSLVLRAIFGGSSSGVVTLSTTPSDARVLIDGRPAVGSSSPYTLSDLPAGKHELQVQKNGFVDYHASFVLARGEQKMLPPVELVANVREAGFSIRSTPPGAEVWVDGKTTEQLTPAKLTGVVPGIHRLQLKRPGYADYDLQMFVPEGTVLQLAADLVLADVASHEAPAREVKVAAASHSEPRASAADDASDRQASHAAHKSVHEQQPPQQQHAFNAPPPQAAAPYAPARMPQPMPAASSAPSAAAAAPGRAGILRINSRPWAQIIVDGRLMGNTPQPNIQLSPGTHKVQLVNQPMGLSKSFTISVKAGEVVTKVMNLAE